MRLIGIKTGVCDRFILKNLQEYTWYPFGDYTEPKESNNWAWQTEEQIAAEESCQAMYKTLEEKKDSSLKITVNCIVGKNGSGKSSLLDLLYRIINNFSYHIFDELWEDNDLTENPQRGHSLKEAKKFDATLFFETDGVLRSIRYYYGKYEYRYHSGGKDSEMILTTLTNKISETTLKSITRHLFYLICSNYSLHSLNEDDYTPDRLWIDKDKDVNGKWLRGLFHKNDGYLTPIVMVPYRDEKGIINVKNENELAKLRLATLSLLFASQGKKFLDGYKPKSIVYRFREDAYTVYNNKFNELYRKQLPLNNQTSILKRAIKTVWRQVLKSDFSKQYKDMNGDVREAVLSYLTYKTLKTCLSYRAYGKILGIRAFNEDEKKRRKGKAGYYLDYREGSIDEIIDHILHRDAEEHTNQKIRQLLDCLSSHSYDFYPDIPEDWPGDPKGLVEFGWHKKPVSLLFNTDGNRMVPFKTYSEAFLKMPPAIFEWDICFSKNGKDEETLSQMSSGERQFMHSLSYMIYHINNLQSVRDDSTYRIKYHNLCLIFDEAELYYHPEYQRLFISRLIKTLSWCHINTNIIRGVNILIVTHSPFVLSDVPLSNTLYLEDGKVDSDHKQTFSGNIHEMLGDNFFMDYSIGEIAKQNIEEIISLYNKINIEDIQQINRVRFQANRSKYKYIASIVADDYLRRKVREMVDELDAKYCLDSESASLDRRISDLQHQLEILEAKRKNIQTQPPTC